MFAQERTTGVQLAKTTPDRPISAPPRMVPATPLSPVKALVVRAVDAAGSQTLVADDCNVSQQHVGRWVNPSHEALPNVRHMFDGPASFARVVAQGVIDHHDATEVMVSLDDALLRREAVRVNMRSAALLERIDGVIASGDAAAMGELRRQLLLLGEQVRRIERGLRAAQQGRGSR
ncbi:MAG: hypothetical protein EOO74_02740 [Myxococcales bacterium]|nr:MAG: hypothetical protein EOO74_02740 [Myxococcales bacterium]